MLCWLQQRGMKILFYTMQLGPRYHHGSERYVETLGGALAAAGHEVVYLAGDPLGRGSSAELGEPVAWKGRLRSYPTSDWTAVEGLPASRVKPWLAGLAPDIVHVSNPAHVGMGLARACRELAIPLVVTTMDFWWICPRSTLLRGGKEICSGAPGWLECVRCVASDHPQKLLRTMAQLPVWFSPVSLALMSASGLKRGHRPADALRWTQRRPLLLKHLASASQVIFPSQALRRALAPHLAKDRCAVIPYGLAEPWFAEPKKPLEGPRSPDDLCVGFAGSLLPHKGAHLLLEAVSLLRWRGTRIRIAGVGEDPGYRERLARVGEGLRVTYEGELDEGEMIDFLRDIDVLVVPSRWPENLPFVLLEAQAAHLPVIGSRVEGIAGAISDTARLFEPDSARDLARALEDLCRSGDDSERPRVWSVEEMRSATEAVYRSALESALPSSPAG
jgi:glycosyltransferase involved in cell wall biosynthesis